jgi:hypothetical protein
VKDEDGRGRVTGAPRRTLGIPGHSSVLCARRPSLRCRPPFSPHEPDFDCLRPDPERMRSRLRNSLTSVVKRCHCRRADARKAPSRGLSRAAVVVLGPPDGGLGLQPIVVGSIRSPSVRGRLRRLMPGTMDPCLSDRWWTWPPGTGRRLRPVSAVGSSVRDDRRAPGRKWLMTGCATPRNQGRQET